MKSVLAVSAILLAATVGCQHKKDTHAPLADAMPAEAATPATPATQPGTAPVKLVGGLGDIQHPVSTSNEEAQMYFNQGLAYVYAFNHAEAIQSFARAAELDPQLAMAWWGQSLAMGPNINKEVNFDEEKAAYDTCQKALSLAANASPKEQAYISALAKRYSNDPNADLKQHAIEYNRAMAEIVKQYPDDLDAATLYAESGMNLRPWKLYTKDGKPEPGTEEIVAVLESVLVRNPNHTGANHYYIHATEASLTPQRALPSAKRLPTIAPAAGHLVHMPAHVYIRIGDHQAAIRANEQAAKVDEKFISCCGPKGGFYPVVYYSHNLHFLAVSATMCGQWKVTDDACKRLTANIAPIAKEVPLAQPFLGMPALMQVRFAKWDEILAAPEPDESMPSVAAAQHFARGMAHVAKKNLPDAGAEQAKLAAAAANAKDEVFSNNSMALLTQIATYVLAGRIAEANGDRGAAVEHLRLAVLAQDDLVYDEPPPWPWFVRESLGAMLLRMGAPAEAEKVFRRDLELNLNNPRSLMGLAASLRAQGKDVDAVEYQTKADAAFANADVVIRLEDF